MGDSVTRARRMSRPAKAGATDEVRPPRRRLCARPVQPAEGWRLHRCGGIRRSSDARRLRPGRVAPGSRPPGAPTDPDVRDSRIRLFRSRVRCTTIDRVDGDGCGERIACLEPLEVRPGEVRPSASATQPLPPPLAHGVAEPRDRRRVPGDPVVAVVAAEFPGEHRMLPRDWRMSMLPTPPGNGPEGSAEPVTRRLALDDPRAAQ